MTNKNNQLFSKLFAISSLFISYSAYSLEVTGRFSMLGTTAQAQQGDAGYLNKNTLLTADQQSLRLMLDETKDKSEWSLHIKTARSHLTNIPSSTKHSSDLFRYKDLSYKWIDDTEANYSNRLGYEIDRAVYKHHFNNISLSLGRQPVDLGSGRFWQPMNVFGSFSPVDLDTDYKQGLDLARVDWFMSDFSSLTAVHAFAPTDNDNIEASSNNALHYRQQVGQESEYVLLAASILKHQVIAASFESVWNGFGWRVEAANYNKADSNFTFMIAGADYQLDNGTLITAEWYHNSRGLSSTADIATIANDEFTQYGLQQHLSKNVFGLSMSKTLSPLLSGSYTLLSSSLNNAGTTEMSLLHQLSLTYSVSDESDLLFSILSATGKGLTSFSSIQSEFGHSPSSASIRLRFYF